MCRILLTRDVQDDIVFSVFVFDIEGCSIRIFCRELNRKYFPLVLVVVYLVVTGCAELMFCFLFWHGVRNWIKLARVVRELFNRFD